MSEIFPDRDEWLTAFRELACRRAPVPSASVESPIAPLRPRTARKVPKIEQPATARPCSRCQAEPRAGSSGWGKRCISEKMRNLRAARQLVNRVPRGQSVSPSAAIEHGRARMVAARTARRHRDQRVEGRG
jgi:hypothetical protein